MLDVRSRLVNGSHDPPVEMVSIAFRALPNPVGTVIGIQVFKWPFQAVGINKRSFSSDSFRLLPFTNTYPVEGSDIRQQSY